MPSDGSSAQGGGRDPPRRRQAGGCGSVITKEKPTPASVGLSRPISVGVSAQPASPQD